MNHASTTLVIGRRKFGKSTYLRKVLLPNLNLPVAVLDVKGEYGPEDGFNEIYYNIDDFIAAGRFHRASLRFDLEDASTMFEISYHYSPHVLVIEESHLYCSPHNIDPGLSRLIRMGGEPGISVILVSQRVKDFPQIVYSMADKMIVFQQRSIHDVESLGDILGENNTAGLSSLARDQYKEFDM